MEHNWVKKYKTKDYLDETTKFCVCNSCFLQIKYIEECNQCNLIKVYADILGNDNYEYYYLNRQRIEKPKTCYEIILENIIL